MRLTLAALSAAALAAPLLAVAAPATATTTCTNTDMGSVMMRNCKVDSSRIGGLVQGGIYWTYKNGAMGQTGDVVLDNVKDRTADGKCTRVKIWYRDPSGDNLPETRKWRFCSGRSGQVRATLNQGESGGEHGGGSFPVYTKGYYSVWHCSGRKHKTCIRVWKQNVAEAKDPT